MKLIKFSFLILLLFSSKISVGQVKNDSIAIYHSLNDYLSSGFEIMDSINGNLNHDEYDDLILVLKKSNEEELSMTTDILIKRPLLILYGNTDKSYTLVSKNEKTVYCNICGGIMGDPYVTTNINDGSFTIEHYGGSNWRWTYTITYDYDIDNKEWYLGTIEKGNFHVFDLENIDTIILTEKELGIIKFEEFDIYE